jgi:pyruvate dehydrogenase E2 component (dihydrolipoamide acetyltransferase)
MDVLMPQLGETVTEGTVSKWYKAVGDKVTVGDALLEIETDKTTIEVPSLITGVLSEIRTQAGQTVAVGTIVAVLSDNASTWESQPTSSAQMMRPPATEAVATPVIAAASAAAARSPIDTYHGVRTPERNFGKAMLPSGVKVTPLARRLAAEASIDLETVPGSGPHGRIVAADIRVVSRDLVPDATAVPVVTPGVEQLKTQYAGVPFRELPVDGMRRTIARRLSESKQQVPHFYLSADLNVDALLSLRKQVMDRSGERVSVNDMIVKAYALALQNVPAANVIWAANRMLQFDRSDVGVAVAVSGGLVTPIVRSVEGKGLLALSRELAGLVARARKRRLLAAEYTGGSGSVSNLGMYGVRSFQAIVNPPQSSILAIGAAERRPIASPDGSLRVASMMTVTLSLDHRAVDGATGGEFLAALRKIVEQPLSIL